MKLLGLLLLLCAITLIIGAPIIWAFNTLFDVGITYTLKNYIAVWVLLVMFGTSGMVSRG